LTFTPLRVILSPELAPAHATTAPISPPKEGTIMLLITTEEKAQGWRAVAVMNGGAESLLFVGRSSKQVRDEYVASFQELLDDGEQESVGRIDLQQWQGAPDAGRWLTKAELRNPLKVRARVAA